MTLRTVGFIAFVIVAACVAYGLNNGSISTGVGAIAAVLLVACLIVLMLSTRKARA